MCMWFHISECSMWTREEYQTSTLQGDLQVRACMHARTQWVMMFILTHSCVCIGLLHHVITPPVSSTGVTSVRVLCVSRCASCLYLDVHTCAKHHAMTRCCSKPTTGWEKRAHACTHPCGACYLQNNVVLHVNDVNQTCVAGTMRVSQFCVEGVCVCLGEKKTFTTRCSW